MTQVEAVVGEKFKCSDGPFIRSLERALKCSMSSDKLTTVVRLSVTMSTSCAGENVTSGEAVQC